VTVPGPRVRALEADTRQIHGTASVPFLLAIAAFSAIGLRGLSVCCRPRLHSAASGRAIRCRRTRRAVSPTAVCLTGTVAWC
jgi:hypothetical protein